MSWTYLFYYLIDKLTTRHQSHLSKLQNHSNGVPIPEQFYLDVIYVRQSNFQYMPKFAQKNTIMRLYESEASFAPPLSLCVAIAILANCGTSLASGFYQISQFEKTLNSAGPCYLSISYFGNFEVPSGIREPYQFEKLELNQYTNSR